MAKLRILLACGSGASSGFMASSMRRAAKAKKLDAEIKACSDSELDSQWDDVDCVMIGPHLKYVEAELQEKGAAHNVKVSCVSKAAYGCLNGEKALQEALLLIEEGKKEGDKK